jgi:hypothetical protein
MAKLHAFTKIIMPGDKVINAKCVFDATPEQAKQFDKMGSARPATAAEIKAADEAEAIKNGLAV